MTRVREIYEINSMLLSEVSYNGSGFLLPSCVSFFYLLLFERVCFLVGVNSMLLVQDGVNLSSDPNIILLSRRSRSGKLLANAEDLLDDPN